MLSKALRLRLNFFKQLAKVFNQKFDIYCLGTNIYTLYKKLKEIDFNGDLKDMLIEMHPDKKEMLSKKFAYTYLVFDCDAHHPKKNDKRSLKDIIINNFAALLEMARYFVDETDPSIGKLYINYPMMESYKDCDDFFENKYSDTIVNIDNLSDYKKRVGKCKMCKIHINCYTKENFSFLILQNIFKLNKITNQVWDKLGYEEYLKCSNNENILKKEIELVKENNIISVLNTSLFMIADFFGNRDGFYDDLLKLVDKKQNM